MKEGGNEPRMQINLEKLEKEMKWILSWSSRKECSPANTLVLAQ
jgi:hypothetical protein